MERKNEWKGDGGKEGWLNVSAGHPTGNAEAATLDAISDREKEWMKMYGERMNEKRMERRKEVWLNISAGHPTGNAEAATLHAMGDRKDEKGMERKNEWKREW